MSVDIGIVLTGTINPNISSVVHTDPAKRKVEYLDALNFYQVFAPVYFLENSSFPLLMDSDFKVFRNVSLRKVPPAKLPERGKGYMELDMIKKWIESESNLPSRFIKITGRYIIKNFKPIFEESLRQPENCILIDQYKRGGIALTWLFYCGTNYYCDNLLEVYQACDDRIDDWIERVLFRRLSQLPLNCRFFREEPLIEVVDGITGKKCSDGFIKHQLKQTLRIFNRLIDKKYLYLRG